MPLISLEKPPRALQDQELLEQTCTRVKKIVNCVRKMHTSTIRMQVKLARCIQVQSECTQTSPHKVVTEKKELTVLTEVRPREIRPWANRQIRRRRPLSPPRPRRRP